MFKHRVCVPVTKISISQSVFNSHKLNGVFYSHFTKGEMLRDLPEITQ